MDAYEFADVFRGEAGFGGEFRDSAPFVEEPAFVVASLEDGLDIGLEVVASALLADGTDAGSLYLFVEPAFGYAVLGGNLGGCEQDGVG